jgi:hypothetical protein
MERWKNPMHFDKAIRGALQSESISWIPPKAMDTKIRSAFRVQHVQKLGKSVWSKKMIISLLAACLIIGPSTVFAFASLADEIYGSFDNLKKQVISVSLQEYSAFGMKLSGAKSQLGDEKYAEFIKQVKKLTAIRVTYGKSFLVDDTLLTVEKRKEYKQVLAELQPYFDQLNGDRSSRDVLSIDEYDAYLEALIVYERIASRIDSSNGMVHPDKVPEAMKADYTRANEVMKQVRDKIEVK